VSVVRRALERGVNHIDTAQFYGDGFSNAVIREALSAGSDVVVVTKVGAVAAEGAPHPRPAQKPEELRASVHANLEALGVEQLQIVNLRRIELDPDMPRGPGQDVDLDDQLAEMISLRDEGLIGDIGLSSVSLATLSHALPVGIVCVSNAYSLVARGDEPLLELCSSEGIAWVPYFPLGSAFPEAPKVTDLPDVQAIAAELGATASQVGLAWLLHHSAQTLLIPGTASLSHLESNLATGNVALNDDVMRRLDNIRV
jgi:aryl-alcohol dehydrogenase-like predicted oxidoreductase